MDKSSGSSPSNQFRKFLPVLSIALLCLAIVPSFAFGYDLEGRVKEHTLDNGMKILVLEREGAPIFAAHMVFKVGSVDEVSGHDGAAHMLEHMLFKGTTTLGSKDWSREKPLFEKVIALGNALDKLKRAGADKEKIKIATAKLKKAQAEQKKYVVSESYSRIYSAAGGVGFNAGTSKDTTTYIIRLPANKFELWAKIESDRMKDPVLREYFAERDVVMEERRRSYENSAGGKLYERYLASAFIGHPYGRPIIGWESDIALLPYPEVMRFLKAWYVPSNVVVAVVGAVKFEDVVKTMEKYFGDIPAGKLPDRVITEEPRQGGERRVDVEFDASPTFIMGFHKPVYPNEDEIVFEVINYILSSGRTSRFDQEIVRKKKVAISIGAWTGPGDRYPNLFSISGDPVPPHTTKDVEDAVWEELEKLKTEPVSSDELRKVINNVEAGFIRGLVSHYGMARLLTHYEVMTGDWRNITHEIEKIKAVTPDDIQRVAKKYFTHNNVTVATLVKKKNEKTK
ncbi:Zinc protease [hydrothermal vent metagenome]|uniref:Zinc protease n=1 Tax=hydrothermal vent metagenome TaxID=652676 RepID=A0A3B1CMJ6_9ZZZZ